MKMLFEVEEVQARDLSSEWYTPERYIQAAREVMGPIALDPASCEEANGVVQARRYYTREQSGLEQDWTCESMWLNPPFGRRADGRSGVAAWIARLLIEYQRERVEQAILTCMVNTEASWFTPLWEYPICFPRRRVLFYRPGRGKEHHAWGTCFIYFGTQVERFTTVFERFGPVVVSGGVRGQRKIQQALLSEEIMS